MGEGSEAQPEPGATGAESTQGRYSGQRDEEDEEDESAVSSEGLWLQSWSDQPEMIYLCGGGNEGSRVSIWEETRHWS